MTNRARVNRWVLACALAATSAVGFGNLASWAPAMVKSLRSGVMDGVVGGGDFAMFWTAGRLASRGEWESLYSLDRFADVMNAPVGAVSFAYPPPFAMALQVLAELEYSTAFSIWLVASIASVAFVLVIERAWAILAFLAMVFSVYVALRFGQLVPFAVLFTVMAGRAFEKDRLFVAGLFLGLLSLKPQFLIGPVIVLLTTPSLRRSALLGVIASAGSIFGLSALVAPEAWRAYLGGLGDVVNPGVSTEWDFSIVALSRSLPLPTSTLVVVGLAIGAVWVAMRASGATDDTRQKVAIGLVLSLLLSPRVVNYDWTLLIPAIAWLSPSVKLDSALVPVGAFVALASLSGFIDVSWVAWIALVALLAAWSTTRETHADLQPTAG